MKLLAYFTAFLLVGLVSTAPTSKEDDTVTVTSEFFPEEFAVYTAEHEIVNLLVPLNALNFEDDTDSEDDDDNNSEHVTIFFVLADTVEGKRVDKGLYIREKGVVTKLLDNGRDASAANDETKTAYFAAKDGIYSYNANEKKAEKYGTVTDSLISIAKVNGSDIIYVLTEDHVIYKITEEGTKKEKIENAVNAQNIVLDYENNLYYYTADNKVYVYNGDGVKQIQGLPEEVTYLAILKPPFVIENGIPVIVNDKSYIAYQNGTVEDGEFQMQVKPSAYAMEATLIQYYAYNKKIYEYNVITLLFGTFLEEIKNFLDGKTDAINEIATRSRSDLRA